MSHRTRTAISMGNPSLGIKHTKDWSITMSDLDLEWDMKGWQECERATLIARFLDHSGSSAIPNDLT